MLKKTLEPLIAVFLLIWAASCSENPGDLNGSDSTTADEFGGYTATSELPGFGDSELIGSEGEEEEIDDPMLTSPAVQDLVNDVEAGMFHFRAVWGRIPYDSTVSEATDWTGSLTISRGGLVVRRLIRFELNQDYYLPRTDRTLVEWISLTTVHNDGIAVDVYVPPARPELDSSWVVDSGGDSSLVVDTIPAAPVTLTFATGPYTRTFSLDELAALNEVVSLDDGNKVAFHGLQMFRRLCPRGILAGRWGRDEDGNGVFKGLWFSPLGRVIGYMRGHYGQNDEGHNVFYGKWINRAGDFEGFLRGTWANYPEETNANIDRHRAGGWFEGRIFDGERHLIGGMGGRYGSAPDVRGGWFQGRWKLLCAEDAGSDREFGSLEDGISTNMM